MQFLTQRSKYSQIIFYMISSRLHEKIYNELLKKNMLEAETKGRKLFDILSKQERQKSSFIEECGHSWLVKRVSTN